MYTTFFDVGYIGYIGYIGTDWILKQFPKIKLN